MVNHKGGNLMFGADGYLYIGLGDGGHGNGPLHLAQTPTACSGKMLRLDVSVGLRIRPATPCRRQSVCRSAGRASGEIWSFGLRNPWRIQFDDPTRGGTGALIMADVGEAGWEEVNYEPAGRGGRNYGWRNREGAHDNILTLAPFSLPLTDPIHEYSTRGRAVDHRRVRLSRNRLGAGIRRAILLRGHRHGPHLVVDAFDHPTTAEATVVGVTEHTSELENAAASVSSFGVDASGELYTVAYGLGQIYRLALDGPVPPPPPARYLLTPNPFVSLGGGNVL